MAAGWVAVAPTVCRRLVTAEVLAIGSELLGFSRSDTNSLYISRELETLGIALAGKAVLPDHLDVIAAAIGLALQRAQIVITTGGLGPTEDDRTVAAAAKALGSRLTLDSAAVYRLRRWFHHRHRRFTSVQKRQAMRLPDAVWLPNARGSAAGQWCPVPGGRVLILLPGPPPELQAMFVAHVLPRLASRVPKRAHALRVLCIAGMSESQVDAIAAPLYRHVLNPTTTILATAAPQVELHIHAVAASRRVAQQRAGALADSIASRLGSAVFSRDQQSLAAVVGSRLAILGRTLAVAESCTGGILSERLTEAAGASAFFLGGIISYANAVKQRLLRVRPSTIRRWGAVSAATAREMAEGVRDHLGADWGLSVTGIAGPAGGTARKPVGTVFIGLAVPGATTIVFRHRFFGDRARIRAASAQAALNHLRLALPPLKP